MPHSSTISAISSALKAKMMLTCAHYWIDTDERFFTAANPLVHKGVQTAPVVSSRTLMKTRNYVED